MALGLDPDLKICCDPSSQSKHPSLPNCTCDPANFKAFVCAPVGPTVLAEVGAAGGAAELAAPDPADATTWPVQPRYVLQDA